MNRYLLSGILYFLGISLNAQPPDARTSPCEWPDSRKDIVDSSGYFGSPMDPEQCEILKEILGNLNDPNDSLYARYIMHAMDIRIQALHGSDREKKMWLMVMWYGGSHEDDWIYMENAENRYEPLHHFSSLKLEVADTVLSLGYKDIHAQDRYACLTPDHSFTLRYNGMNYDTVLVQGIPKSLYDAMGLNCLYYDSILDWEQGNGVTYRLISENEQYEISEFPMIPDAQTATENFFYLLKKEAKGPYELIGVFPAFPRFHMSGGMVDVYQGMPVFQTRTDQWPDQIWRHHFDGERYIGELKFSRVEDEKRYEDHIRLWDEYGFEVIVEE